MGARAHVPLKCMGGTPMPRENHTTPLTIWCNADLPDAEREMLRSGLGSHRLIFSAKPVYNLDVAAGDPMLKQADVAFGQPDVQQIMSLPRLKWIQLTTAGYTRYDRDDLRAALRARGAILTNS